MPLNLSGWELIIILVVALLLFGSRLPSIGRSLGRGIVEFKKGVKGVTDEIEEGTREANRDEPRRFEDRPYRAPLGPSGDDRRVRSGEAVEERVDRPRTDGRDEH